MISIQFVRFLLPLVIAMVVQEFGIQVFNGGMARMPRATETLASFGLALGLMDFLTSPLAQTRQLGLVLVDGRIALRRTGAFVLIFSLLLSGLLLSLAVGPLSVWVIEDLHGVGASMASVVRQALLWLVPLTVLRGMSRFYSGMLMRCRRTEVVSAASMASIGASISTVFLLLPTGFVREQPILLPILAMYAGTVVELGTVLWGHRRYTGRMIGDSGGALTFADVFRFFWPLALIMAIQGGSRPLINLFIAREAGGTQALAVLTVVYALGHIPYSWLNEIRSLAPVFRDRENSLFHIRRFVAGCCLVSFAIAVTMSWTPLREYILQHLIGINAELAAHCKAPLIVFSFFPFAVVFRGYYHGIGLLERRTQAMAPSAPARIGAIWCALMVLPVFDVSGATRGVAALLSGFALEATAVWWGVRGRSRLTTRG